MLVLNLARTRFTSGILSYYHNVVCKYLTKFSCAQIKNTANYCRKAKMLFCVECQLAEGAVSSKIFGTYCSTPTASETTSLGVYDVYIITDRKN